MTTQQPPSFVIAALLASHLHRMQNTAKLMLLSASNAKGVAARAGDSALGFRPITDFIAEMAGDTIQCASKINALALVVSRLSVTALRTQDESRRLTLAKNQLCAIESPKYRVTDRLIADSEQRLQSLQEDTGRTMTQLCAQLDEIHQRVRGSTIVVSTSRSEASRAGEFQKYLNSIADSVEQAAKDLQIEIDHCKKLIRTLTSTLPPR